MGGIHPAYEFITRALSAGKNVVTANKAVVARYLAEFTELAEKNNVKVGDNITLLYGDDEREISLKVGAIFTNYTFHYAVMTSETYKEAFGKPYTPETLLITTSTKNPDDTYKIASYLTENYSIKTWASTSDSRESFANTIERLNYVIVLVVVCAAALAFIVLFNLNNINITDNNKISNDIKY